MLTSLKIALIQFNANTDKAANIRRALVYANQAIERGAKFILFPETFSQRGSQDIMRSGAENIPSGPAIKPFVLLAQEKQVFFLLNICQSIKSSSHLFNTSVVITPEGVLAQYNKIHLFDVDIEEKRFRESDLFQPGDTPVIAQILGIKLGLSICYDLRFPELYRHYTQHGAKILCVPASFTRPTGKAHWETLLRARAIENQCFVLAPAQTGLGANGTPTYGHSMAIDPWGTILCRGTEQQEEVLLADLDLYAQEMLRRQFPVLTHIRQNF